MGRGRAGVSGQQMGVSAPWQQGGDGSTEPPGPCSRITQTNPKSHPSSSPAGAALEFAAAGIKEQFGQGQAEFVTNEGGNG